MASDADFEGLEAEDLGSGDNNALSLSWSVTKAHSACYTGGKLELSSCGSLLACWNAGNVSLVDLRSGRVLLTVSGQEDDGASTFGLSPNGKELVVAGGRSLLLYRFDLSAALPEAYALLQQQDTSGSGSAADPAAGAAGVSGGLQLGERGSVPQLSQSVARWKGHSMPMLDLVWDPTGSLVATASADRSVRVWDAHRNHMTHQFLGHTHIVLKTVFHPNPDKFPLVASSAEDGEIRLWDLRRNKCLATLKNHMSAVPALCFLPNSNLLVSGGRDKIVCVWDIRSLRLVKALPLYSGVTWVSPVSPATAVPGARAGQHYFAVTTETGECHLMEASTLKIMQTLVLPSTLLAAASKPSSSSATDEEDQADDEFSRIISHVLCRPSAWDSEGGASSEAQLVLASADTTIHVLDLGTGRQIKTLLGHNDELLAARLLPSSRQALVANNSYHLRLLDLQTFDCELLSGHTGVVMSVSVSGDGRWAASSSRDRTVRLWDLGADAAPAALSLALPGDGKNATAREELAKALQQRCVAVCSGHADAVNAVVLSSASEPKLRKKHKPQQGLPTGKVFAISGAGDRTLKRWDFDTVLTARLHGDSDAAAANKGTRAPAATISVIGHEKDINALALSPDDQLLASASQDKTVGIWDSTTLQRLGVLRGHRKGVWGVEFGRRDKVVISCSGDKTVRLWSLSDFSCLRTFEGHTGSVLSACLLPSQQQLLSTGADSMLRLWDLRTAESVGAFPSAHEGKIWAMDTDGKIAITAGADSRLCIWEDTTAQEKELAVQLHQGLVVQEQRLSDALRSRDWLGALALALDLGQPRRLLSIFTALLQYHHAERRRQTVDLRLEAQRKQTRASAAEFQRPTQVAEDTPALQSMYINHAALADVLSRLPSEKLGTCIKYVLDWCVNAKHCHVGQQVLTCILQVFGPEQLVAIPQLPGRVTSLLAYSQRHYDRVERLLHRAHLIDWSAQRMGLLAQSDTAPPPPHRISGGGSAAAVDCYDSVLDDLLKLKESSSAVPAEGLVAVGGKRTSSQAVSTGTGKQGPSKKSKVEHAEDASSNDDADMASEFTSNWSEDEQ